MRTLATVVWIVLAHILGFRPRATKPEHQSSKHQEKDTMKTVLALFLAVALTSTACNTSPPLPSCPASVVSETCVDHQDVATCMVDSAPVTGCTVPSGVDQGVECVSECPSNRYDRPACVAPFPNASISYGFCDDTHARAVCEWMGGNPPYPLQLAGECQATAEIECVERCTL